MKTLFYLDFKRVVLYVLLLGIILLNGCSTISPNVLAASNASAKECPPIPTPTPENAPTTEPYHGRPTAAPPPTSGPRPRFETPEPYPTLAVSLATHAQVVAYLFERNKYAMAAWDEPWCVETLTFDPNRISFEHYNTLKEYDPGRQFAAEYEPIWVVTIRGQVLPIVPGWGLEKKSGYISYIVGQDSGAVYGLRAGPDAPPPASAVTRTPKTQRTRTPRRTPTP